MIFARPTKPTWRVWDFLETVHKLQIIHPQDGVTLSQIAECLATY
jgi:hypothetical protein